MNWIPPIVLYSVASVIFTIYWTQNTHIVVPLPPICGFTFHIFYYHDPETDDPPARVSLEGQ